jgi:TM2 domain-containing membrane protein YozV
MTKRGKFMNYKRKHPVPALLSFFIPGLGQLVKGHRSKAVGIWAALGICIFMSVIGIGILMAVVVWMAQIYDAYYA